MGNEKSVFRNATIQTQPYYTCQQYALHYCKHENRPYTLFQLNGQAGQEGLKHWKALRHPHILRYYECGEHQKHMCLLCEPVRPLREEYTCLTADEIICGLSHLCEALSFLHDRCGLSHGQLSLDTIFISSNHSWKLGCLQNVKQIPDRNQVHQEDMKKLAQIFRILLGGQRSGNSSSSSSSSSSCALPSFISSLESDVANERPRAVQLLQDQLFTSDYLQIVNFLINFASFEEPQILSFFQTIVARLRSLPLEVLSQKLIPLILTSRFVMMHPSADQYLLPYLFTCVPTASVEEPLLNVKLFKTHIVPLICKLYCVRKVQIRLILLRYLPWYARFLELSTLKEQILPQIWLAEKDENNELVAATYVAIGELVRIHGSVSILGGERKRLFSQIIPRAIRRSDSFSSTLLPNETQNCKRKDSCADDSTANSSLLEEASFTVNTTSDTNLLNQQNEFHNTNQNGFTTSKDEEKEKSQETSNDQLLQQNIKTLRIMSLSRIGDSRKSSADNSSSASLETSSLVDGVINESNGLNGSSNQSKHYGLKNGRSSNKVSSADLESDIKTLNIKPKMNEIDQLFSDMTPKLQFKQTRLVVPIQKKQSQDVNTKFSVNLEDQDSAAGWGIEDDDEVNLSDTDIDNRSKDIQVN